MKILNLLLVLSILSFNSCVSIIGSHPSFDKFETNPQAMVGYGYVNPWIQKSDADWENMANAMVENKLNVTQVELLSFGYDGYYMNPNLAVDKFVEFAKIMKSRKITILVTVVNWNYGGNGAPPNSNDSICNSKYNITWYTSIINRIKNEVGEDGIILEPASEWGPGSRNSSCWSKAQQFHTWVNGNWTGMKSWNKESRPGSAPAGYFLDWHVDNPASLGPKTPIKIVITDTSNILNMLGGLRNYAVNHAVLSKLVSDCRKNGSGFVLYGFGSPEIDYQAMPIIRDAWYK